MSPKRKDRQAQRKLQWQRAHRSRINEAIAAVFGLTIEEAAQWPRKKARKHGDAVAQGESKRTM